MKFFLLLLSFPLLSFFNQVLAQDTTETGKKRKVIIPDFQSGVIAGMEAANDRMVFKFGKTFTATANVKISTKVSYGVSFGVDFLKNETFLPLAFDFKGMLSKSDNTPYLSAQLGYAIGISDKTYIFDNYTYRGGLFFSPGYGYRFSVKDKYYILMNLNYKHQFAYINYNTFDRIYRESLSFHLLSLRLGVQF